MKVKILFSKSFLFIPILIFFVVSVDVLAVSPTITRNWPSNQYYSVNKGTTINFSIEATDSDGDLKAAEWFFGATSMKWDPWLGRPKYYATSTWSYTFNTIGTFYVYLYVYDDSGNKPMIWWEITVPNHTPMASRQSPTTSSVTIQVGATQIFTVSASDQDGNLAHVEWFLGSSSRAWHSIVGSTATDSWSYSFNSTGTFNVYAYVYDTENANAMTWWEVIVKEPSGNLQATVQDQNGSSRSNAECLLYDNNFNYLGNQYNKTTNSSGVATWSGLPIGTYNIEAYYSGPSPFLDPEYWITKQASVSNNTTTNVTLRRNRPYALNVQIRLNGSTGPILTSSSLIAPNSEIWICVTVTHQAGFNQDCKVKFVLDRAKDAPFDIDLPDSSYQTIPTGQSRQFTFTTNPSQPGTYYYALMVQTLVNSAYIKTDGWDWVQTLQIVNLPSTPSPNGSLNYSGITWNKIDWNWYSGLRPIYSSNVFLDAGDIVLRVLDNTGLGSQLESSTSQYHYGTYIAKMRSCQYTPLPQGTCLGFFYFWRNPDTAQYQEIDVEILSWEPGYVHFRVQGGGDHFLVAVPNQNTQYHEYGFRWLSDRVEFLLDGLVPNGYIITGGTPATGWITGSYVEAIAKENPPDQPGTVILNHWTGEVNWSGTFPIGAGDLDARVNNISYSPYQESIQNYYVFDGHDFDGNGRSDISIWRPSNGIWFIKDIAYPQWGTAGDIPVNGDYDGNLITDVAVWRPSNGVWFVKNQSLVQWGTIGDIPVPGKYDSDNKTDMAVWRPSDGCWYIKYSGGGVGVVQWGTSGDIPVPGDYDGDGITDIAVWRPSNGCWFIKKSGGGVSIIQWGTSGDIPVPGKYDSDNKTDIAVWRPSGGYWFIQKSAGGMDVVQYGTSGDIPVPGDYDGNGSTDIAVFRPSNGFWFVKGQMIVQWGTSGDVPLVR
jgi:hypothetical protein